MSNKHAPEHNRPLSDERIAAIVRSKPDSEIAEIVRYAILSKMAQSAGVMPVVNPGGMDVVMGERDIRAAMPFTSENVH
ncbi:hypothetical protein [uncultured Tolumonas sp.]|jgi:hypothetical protein|uniref:hypothetical protein n=1 Tax=uncultured Tolumonas sp. TaxID=263765 RepID=UPI002A0A3E81|nr:hypothetical protein [uncultured Tolumonas sp.]